MEFNYRDPGVKTVEQAVFAALLDTAHGVGPTIVDPAYIRSQAEALLEEVRTILTGELSTLFDRDGVAADWNDAIELSIRVVEGTTP